MLKDDENLCLSHFNHIFRPSKFNLSTRRHLSHEFSVFYSVLMVCLVMDLSSDMKSLFLVSFAPAKVFSLNVI